MFEVSNFLLIGGFLFFSIGIFIILAFRNLVIILTGIEMILNAANLNILHFSGIWNREEEGQAVVIILMVIAAAQAAIALAIILNAYNFYKTLDIDKMHDLRD